MYKKQMILQRIVCYGLLVATALVFIYSLGLVTDMYECKFAYYAENYETVKPKVAGTEVYYLIQPFNKSFTSVALALMLLAISQIVFRNHVRRKYYIANYITVIANTIAPIVATVWAISNIFYYRGLYLQVDFEAMKKRAEAMKFPYTKSTFWFDISIFIFGLLLFMVLLNLVNLVWKVIVMSAEKKLIKAGKED